MVCVYLVHGDSKSSAARSHQHWMQMTQVQLLQEDDSELTKAFTDARSYSTCDNKPCC